MFKRNEEFGEYHLDQCWWTITRFTPKSRRLTVASTICRLRDSWQAVMNEWTGQWCLISPKKKLAQGNFMVNLFIQCHCHDCNPDVLRVMLLFLVLIITGDEGGALPWKASSIDHYQDSQSCGGDHSGLKTMKHTQDAQTRIAVMRSPKTGVSSTELL